MKCFIMFLFLFLTSCSSYSESNIEKIPKNKIKFTKVYEGDGVLWGFDFINENEVLINHKRKGSYYYNLKNKEKVSLASPEVKKGGQGGLLDMNYHDGKVFITYSKKLKNGNIVTTLAKGKYSNKKISNLKDIYVSNAFGDNSIHFGSRTLIIGDELYMTLGERSERDKSQDLSFDNGKILRLTLEGKPYPKNRFNKDRPQVFAYGLRNSQGIAYDGRSIWVNDFGPRGGDELNIIEEGKNYGWPVITYGNEYWGPSIGEEKKKGMEQPVAYWVPSISPSGLGFYSGDKIKLFKNKLFIATLSAAHLRMVEVKDKKVVKQTMLFHDLKERIRQVKISPDKKLYFSTDSGKLYQIEGIK